MSSILQINPFNVVRLVTMSGMTKVKYCTLFPAAVFFVSRLFIGLDVVGMQQPFNLLRRISWPAEYYLYRSGKTRIKQYLFCLQYIKTCERSYQKKRNIQCSGDAIGLPNRRSRVEGHININTVYNHVLILIA